MKIVIAASEVVPFAKTGGLADVAGALPLALENLGNEVIVALPKYKIIQDSKFNIRKLKQGISFTILGRNIKVYFIENDKYFNRDGLYGDKSGDHKDNLERFSYYCKMSLQLLREINFRPDIIHVHDWQTSLIPVYLKNLYPSDSFYKKIKSVLTIHNIGYQGLFPKEEFSKLGLDWKLFSVEGFEFYGKINILKAGIIFSDIINTVSPTYSKEIQTNEFGFGLEGVLNKRKGDLFGILNGLDYSIWNPEIDKFIVKNFSIGNIQDKYKNKEDLQRICHLSVTNDVPLFGIVSRLAEQKGFDILSDAIEKICKMRLQLVILGTGDIKYHELLEEMVKKYPKVISLHLKFDDPLAHKIYAGSDIFLMPSKYEPCGLGQMISLKYGTIPLVFKTGGLADTVTKDNGFVFDKYNKDDLSKTIAEAVKAFADKKRWLELIKKAMQCNFSWEVAAENYMRIYEKAKSK
ncbi:MAG: glycogen synthase GlgA [Candidatus Omnitrophica bacterium]|nr:glycogen synthase GlgA [Candidatus Omnitrophota bacterium]